jgi:hypothetical protein
MPETARCPTCGLGLTDLESWDDKCPSCGTLTNLPSTSLAATRTATASVQQAVNGVPADHDDAAAEVIAFLPGEVLADRYRIVNLVGRGGMGAVYRADDLRVGQPVALKFLSPVLARDQARLARFIGEVRLARRISHPNVCRVYDLGETQGRPYLSMEYIDGEDLSSLLRRVGRLPADKALDVAHQLCAGLAAAHDKGVLHLDLKPPNVMIDGRGRALITDFGIAAPADKAAAAQGAGTPAYMAPEQLTKQGVAIQTDLYALGLVLCEIFTGRRVFDAARVAERLRSPSARAALPSDVMGDIEPVVEQAILSCLEHDARRRPQSAMEVAASLPGRSALSAALAAGRVPSPDMVAAARRPHGLPLATAWMLFVIVIAGICTLAWLSPWSRLTQGSAFGISPDVLVDRARAVARRAGYHGAFVDSAYGWTLDYRLLEETMRRDTSSGRWARIASGQPTALRFWYRQSPRPLVPIDSLSPVSTDDPPHTVPGMIQVMLDADGTLQSLLVVPSARADAAPSGEVNWSSVLTDARLDPAWLRPSRPVGPPIVFGDTHAVWQATLPGRPDTLRVSAVALQGAPVHFSVDVDWPSDEATTPSGVSRSQTIIGSVLSIGVIALAIVLARRNVLTGRGDRGGAWKTASFVFVAILGSNLLEMTHAGILAEGHLFRWRKAVEPALYIAALAWLTYLAVEPVVRRRWPDALVSWTRLLAGRFRDPLVGRDLLFGAAAGCVAALLVQLQHQLAVGFGVAPPLPVEPNFGLLGAPRQIVAFVLTLVAASITAAFALATLLVVMTRVFRHRGIAVTVLLVLYTAVFVSRGGHPLLTLPLIIGANALTLAVLLRVGLLGVMALLVFFLSFISFPHTVDPSVWYAGRSWAVLGLLVGLAAYAFQTSLAGQPMFGRLVED